MIMKTCDNIMEWSGDLPGGTLPFFVWTAAHKLSYDDCLNTGVFERLYHDFITTMRWCKDTPEFRAWCWDQYVHHFECIK